MSLLIFFYKSYVTENQILRLKHPILNQNQPFLSFCDIQAHIVFLHGHFYNGCHLWHCNGTIYIDPGIKKKHGGISCSITFFDRIDDFGNKDLKTFYFSDETKLPLLSDY
jgi:hypothetical protein